MIKIYLIHGLQIQLKVFSWLNWSFYINSASVYFLEYNGNVSNFSFTLFFIQTYLCFDLLCFLCDFMSNLKAENTLYDHYTPVCILFYVVLMYFIKGFLKILYMSDDLPNSHILNLYLTIEQTFFGVRIWNLDWFILTSWSFDCF